MIIHRSEKKKPLVIYIISVLFLFFLRMGLYIGQNSAGKFINIIELFIIVSGIVAFLFTSKKILWHHALLFLFCAFATITTFFSDYSFDMLDKLVNIWFFFCIFSMCNYLSKFPYDIQSISKVCIFAVIIYSIMYFINVINASNYVDQSGAINSVYFATLLLPFVLLQNKTLYKAVGIIVIVAITLISNKRAAFIAIAVSFIIYFISTKNNSKKHTARNYLLILLFVVVLVLSAVEFGFLSQIEVFNNLSNMFEDGGSGRTDIYSHVWNLIKGFSLEELLFGRGFNSVSASIVGTSAHNDFLEILHDYGIVGILLYISFIFSICRYAYKHISSKYKPIFSVSIGMFLIISLFSHLIIYKTQIAYFAILWPLLMNKIPRGEENESTPYQLR